MAWLNMFNILLLFGFSLYVSTISTSSEYIPVFMLDTKKNDEASDGPLPALTQISEGDFKHILVDKMQDKNKVVLVFAEESLSPEDFRLFHSDGISIFASGAKQKFHVHYYPYVETALKVLKSLNGVKITELPNGLTKSNIDAKPGDVLLFDLDDATDDEGRPEMIHRHDISMASIIKKFASVHKNLLILYTGHRSSYFLPSEPKINNRQTRHLLAKEESTVDNGWSLKRNNILVYFGQVPTFVSKINTSQFKKDEVYKIENCTNNNINQSFILDLCIKDSKDQFVANINFVFVNESGYWNMNNINWYIQSENQSDIKVMDIFAPYGFSYHCNQVTLSDKDNNFIISLIEFQVQVLSDEESTRYNFSSPYDCIGFTTTPIWSGLFVTFILAMIMTFGLCMIMDIKTMDRFDDPKGKTISINVSE